MTPMALQAPVQLSARSALPPPVVRATEPLPTTGQTPWIAQITTGDLAYATGLLVATAFVVDALRSQDVVLTDRIALAALPWAVAAASLSVLTRNVSVPPSVSPLLSSPLAYLTTFVLGGCLCVLLSTHATEDTDPPDSTVPTLLARCGWLFVLPIVAVTLAVDGRQLRLLWPAAGLLVSVLMTGALWGYLSVRVPTVTARTGALGVVVLFGHLLDANTTLIGIDILGFREQTPLPQSILDVAGTLPVADRLGVGWLFLAVKAVIAVAIVHIVAVAVDSHHRPVLLGVTAVAGLGPGVHNLVLYIVL
jgi:uncharacterized membrane protein